MTAITDRRTVAIGNGTITAFTGPPASASGDISVYLSNTSTSSVDLGLVTSGYTITGLGGSTTTVTFTTAPASGREVVIVSVDPAATSVDGSAVDVTRLVSIFPSISSRSKTKDRFDFLEVLDNEADREAVRNYAMTSDLTSHLQEALYYAVRYGYRLEMPAGNVPLTTWSIDSSDAALTSLSHIHIEGAGACDPRNETKGTLLQQISGTSAPALKVYGDWSINKQLRGVRIRGLAIVGATANTDWLFDTRNISGFGSVIEDVNLYVRNKAGNGFRGISNWAIRYQDLRVDGVATGDGTAYGTGASIYGDNTYGVTNQTILANVQINSCGRGLQLAHYDEMSVSGTTQNIVVMGGQVYQCDQSGLVIGFLRNSQLISVHVEQCQKEGWLFGKSSGLGPPANVELIGCHSHENGLDGTSYDMNIVQGTGIEINAHYFENTDRGITIAADTATDAIVIRKPRFRPNSDPGDTALDNPGTNNTTRVIVEDPLFFPATGGSADPPYYTNAYTNPKWLQFPVRRGGWTGNTDGSTTLVLESGQTHFRLAYTNAATIDKVAHADWTVPENGQRFTISASNAKITLANGGTQPVPPPTMAPIVPFAIPEGSLTLEQDVVYEFICDNGSFVPIHDTRLTSTTTALNSKTNVVNTTSKAAGRMVFNTTTSKPVWATGSSSTSTWVDATGATTNTPT